MSIRTAVQSRSSAVHDAACVLAGVLAAGYGFRSSFGGWTFLVVLSAGVLVGTVGVWIATVLRLPLLVGFVVVAGLYLVVGGVIAFPERATVGFLPSVDSVDGAAHAAIHGWKELVTTAPPVSGVGDLMAIPVFVGVFAGASAFALSQSRRGMRVCVLPLVATAMVAIGTGTRSPSSLAIQGLGLALVSLVWSSMLHSRGRPQVEGHAAPVVRFATSAVLLGPCVLVGWVGATHLPLVSTHDRVVWRESFTPPFDPRQYPSPLSGYRRYLKDPAVKDAVLFTVEGLPDNTLIRLATLDAYDGLVWRSSHRPDDPSVADAGYFERVGSQITPTHDGETATVVVTIGDYSDVWVPDVGEVLSLRFEGGPRDDLLNASFRYNRTTDAAVSGIPLQTGDRYVMEVVIPPRVESLEGQVISPNEFVPESESSPDVVAWASTEALLTVDDIGTRIEMLLERMKEQGTYSDGIAGEQAPSRAGHSLFRLKEFVGAPVLIGNAEQYAATLALALRDLNRIPTRVVMGFSSSADNGNVTEITGSQVEAWVEVPIEGRGWVAVLPTPDRDDTSVKQRNESPPEPDYDTQIPPQPPVIEPAFDEPATSKSGAPDTAEDTPVSPEQLPTDETSADPLVDLSGGAAVAAVAVGLPVSLVCAVAGMIIAAKRIRARRRRRRGPSRQRVANAWFEFTDRAIDMGRPVPMSSTRREAAQFVDRSAVPLAIRADRAVFGPNDPDDETVERYWDDLEAILRSMRRTLGPIERAQAAVSLTSLRVRSRRREGTERTG